MTTLSEPTTANTSELRPTSEPLAAMDRPHTILKSKLGKRIVLLFLVCALVPISALGAISYIQVKSQLNAQTERWLHQETKSRGMAILDRISLLKAEILSLRGAILDHMERKRKSDLTSSALVTGDHFRGVTLVGKSELLTIQGKAQPAMTTTPVQMEHLAAGNLAIITRRAVGGGSLAYLVAALDPVDPAAGLIWGEMNIPFLLSQDETDTLPGMSDLVLLDQDRQVLYATTGPDPGFLNKVRAALRTSSSGMIRWSGSSGDCVAYYWSAFLRPGYLMHQWTVVLSMPAEDALGAMKDFSRALPKVLFVSFVTVFLLSLVQLRRNLRPLQLLNEATRNIANKRFDARVKISTRDEFGELADSFNHMAHRLENQFQLLTAMADIDRTALSFPKQEQVIETILSQVKDRFLIDMVALTVCKKNGAGPKTFMAGRGALPNRPAEVKRPIPKELLDNTGPETMLISREDGRLPAYLSDYTAYGVERFLVLPIRLNGQTIGLLSLGSKNEHLWDEEFVALSRQIADQVGIVLSSASLLEDLEQLNWGTLKALARTVDANSAWTAGHSERVADLVLRIGEEMGLSAADLANLHRAALLHDIGKIGVPASILDKPGKLTEEEYERIKKHPTVGAQILEPISAYTEVVDLVSQHHERFDGRGYPEGLSGTRIALGARIMAVADSFDAMTSDRPYRQGMEVDKSLEIIRSERSRGFDPEVVDAFFRWIEKEQNKMIPSDISCAGPVDTCEARDPSKADKRDV
jgi:putative nucleotidyltransferase with HDIG domain